MNRALRTCIGAILLVQTGTGLAMDCDNAYTRLEQTICGNPQLMEAEQQLTLHAKQALKAGLISRAESIRLRNSVALDCRRAAAMDECLLSAAREKVWWLAHMAENVKTSGDSNSQTEGATTKGAANQTDPAELPVLSDAGEEM